MKITRDITKLSYLDLVRPINNTYFFYDYDASGRLHKVYSGLSSNGTGKLTEGTYSTYADGRLKRLQLANAQGVDFRYDERDLLEQVNHPDMLASKDPGGDSANGIPKDVFGMRIGYHKIQEIGTNPAVPARYNGDITWIWYNMADVTFTGVQGTTPKVGRSFRYDEAGRLTKADFGYKPSTQWAQTLAFDESTYTFDAVGNIATVRRYGETGTLMDNFTYNYSSGTNRLSHISDGVSAGTFSYDIDNQSANNYEYDANGNLTKDVQSGITTAISYDYRNLPTSFTKNSITTTYRYNSKGIRSHKSGTTAGTYYYVNDYLGRTVAVLKADGDPKMFNIHGHEHIGYILAGYHVTYTPPPPYCGEEEYLIQGPPVDSLEALEGGQESLLTPDPCLGTYDTSRADQRFYYLKDQVGNIRMTVESNGDIAAYDDYYPFGMIMATRSLSTAGDNRYKFGTKEKDSESGWDFFGARYYDGRIGRWMSIDPLGENVPNWNPYNYCLNRPLVLKDTDGRRHIPMIHDLILKRAFEGILSDRQIAILQAGSRKVDEDQTIEGAYKHAMKPLFGTEEGARIDMQEFILSKQKEFLEKLPYDPDGALFALGEALHPMMDETSIPHKDFATWHGLRMPWETGEPIATLLQWTLAAVHFLREYFYHEGTVDVQDAIQKVQEYYEEMKRKGEGWKFLNRQPSSKSPAKAYDPYTGEEVR